MRFRHLNDYLKATVIFLTTAIILCLPGLVSAAGTAIVSVSAPTQSVSPGTQLTVSITVQPNNSIAGAQFNLSFNPSLVTVNSIAEGNLLKQNGANTYFTPGQINNIAGTVSGVAGVIISPGQTVSTSGTFAVILLTAGFTEGTCPLTLSNVIIGDINGQPIPVNTVNGQVIIDTNQAPVLSAVGNKTINEGALLSFTISATDPDGDPLTYSASNLPSGASFNASTRTFSWTPNPSQAGTYPNVHFEVTDGSLTDSEDITITVNNVNQAPVLSAIGNKSVTAGQLLSFTISATDPDGNPLTYSASNLPSGASFNASTRTFSWTPTYTQAGTYPNVHFQVSDGSLTDSEDITITVAKPYADWDTNTDGSVNVLDMIGIGQHWSELGIGGWIREDVNADGAINVLDMTLIGQHWTG
jgi:hypothetical protein